jgi:hypothetical protein
MAFFTRNTANWAKYKIITLFLKKIAILLPEIVKIAKIVIITLTP